MPHCKQEKDYHALAQEHGIKWLGKTLPPTTGTSTSWQCDNAHKRRTTYSSIRAGRSCNQCWIDAGAGKLKITLKDYCEMGKKNGYKYLGKSTSNTNTKEKWKCVKCGCIKSCTYQTVKRGDGCPTCHQKRDNHAVLRLTVKDYQEAGDRVGLEWIGKESPQSIHKNTRWKCKKKSCGHKQDRSYVTLTRKRGGSYYSARCLKCGHFVNGVPAPTQQREICELLGAEINYKIGNRVIDGAIVSSKIAIEYDGYYWHGNEVQRDKLRNKEILDAGWSLLRIRSNKRIPDPRHLSYAIQKINEGRKHYRMTLKDWGVGPTKT